MVVVVGSRLAVIRPFIRLRLPCVSVLSLLLLDEAKQETVDRPAARRLQAQLPQRPTRSLRPRQHVLSVFADIFHLFVQIRRGCLGDQRSICRVWCRPASGSAQFVYRRR